MGGLLTRSIAISCSLTLAFGQCSFAVTADSWLASIGSISTLARAPDARVTATRKADSTEKLTALVAGFANEDAILSKQFAGLQFREQHVSSTVSGV